jgi:riboflavin biosynthesis pyrimidine reductase
MVITTTAGAANLRGRLPSGVRIVATGRGRRVDASAIVRVAADEGLRLVLCEGGPHLNGTFLAENLVDELFLTVAPQLLGRAGPGDEQRYGLVEGVSLGADEGRWGRLLSVRRSVDHLFLRYALDRG